MSVPQQQSLFFISVPDLQKLCATRIILKSDFADAEIRSKQLKMCRQLLLLHQDLLVSPVPGILSQIWVVMAIPFYKTGKLSIYFEKHEAKMEVPQRVIPVILQNCLSFTLMVRLTPAWNRIDNLLVQGRQFLSQMGKQNAVVLDINVTETQVCLSLEAYAIRLPPPQIEDFAISQDIIKEFFTEKKSVIEGYSILNNWCYVLPSMKMGQIISILHTVPPDCPFQSYEDFWKHWNDLYGYKLPEECGTPKVYCSVQFRKMGGSPFTCIRSQPVQFFPRVDTESVLRSFLSDLQSKLPHICGFPIKMTTKPYYYTKALTKSHIQENKVKPPNLTTRRMLGSSLSQGPSTLAPRHVPCSSAKGHQVELPASQSIPCGSAALPTVNPQAPGAVPGPSRANPSVQDNTHLSSQSNVALKFVPVFKSHLLQANKSTLGPGKQKKRQQSTEALRAIGTQGDRLSLGPAVPKRLKGQLKAKARNTHHGASAPPQEQKGRYAKRGQHLPSFRTSSAVSLAEGEQLPSSSRSSLNAGREDSAAGFQVQEKRSVMSNYIAQLLGEEHVSFKVRSRPFIFESDWDTEAPQPQPPQAANQREGAGVSECRSSESQRTWPERKRKVLHSGQSKSKKSHHS